jgi:hypothetical protein
VSSLLAQWWAEARDATGSEAEAVGVIAERLGESQTETRRLLTTIARVKVGGTRGKQAKPTARPVSESVSGNGRPEVPQLDEDAVRAYYANGLKSGLSREHALRAVAKRFRVRPHDARLIVSGVEVEL